MEANLDALAAEVRRDLRGALAIISLFSRESGRQLIIGVDGLETGHEAERDIPILESYSTYVHDSRCQLIVDDLAQEGHIASHPVASTLGIRSWAGWPLTSTDGRPHGVVCVMDTRPRGWTSSEVFDLERWAHRYAHVIKDHPVARNWRATEWLTSSP